ncbi:glycosyltransferase N-terminal domain-containing protein [uncultured Winogradskyella sp.]|uniref:3-deoxy-D-manno-octulosonic acid transferase n=1 Tax=uncultured Winogradskyella sp. TaxID=395353 RepID=UPI0030DCBEAC
MYSTGIYIASFLIKLIALFNPKLKKGVIGRRDTFKKLKKEIKPNDKTFWFHCASLGEYEQGLPVFEGLKLKYPDHKIVISFFSPSGYEVRKNAKLADVVIYLPLDTKQNAKRFLDLVNPNYIVFVKYEIWPNILLEVRKRNIKCILISAVFRKNQSFFKWYGGLTKSALFAFDHIFTQDDNSQNLLRTLGLPHVTVSGDTRFDRVSNQLTVDNSISFINTFKQDKLCVVFGSTWPDDDKLFIDYINKSDGDIKFIIAPHDIKTSYIESLKSQLKVKTVCFSNMANKDLSTYSVFILDTIGYLSRVYSYADIAYVGGAAGSTGLHNVLEPAVFGVPILIGKNYKKFPEAEVLTGYGGITSITNRADLETALEVLVKQSNRRKKQGTINKTFIEKNRGAVIQILDYVRI